MQLIGIFDRLLALLDAFEPEFGGLGRKFQDLSHRAMIKRALRLECDRSNAPDDWRSPKLSCTTQLFVSSALRARLRRSVSFRLWLFPSASSAPCPFDALLERGHDVDHRLLLFGNGDDFFSSNLRF